MNEKATIMKPEPITVTLGEETYSLVYDLNAFCEMEKIYDSVDSVIQMLLGTATTPDMNAVAYKGAPCAADDITIGGAPLSAYIKQVGGVRQAKHSDTLNLLWLGCLHDHVEYDEYGDVKRYTVSKVQLGKYVNFGNLREVNSKIVTSILRDLVPAVAEAQGKNVEQAEAQILTMPQ